ncbi:Arginine/ornithine antiporter ArcD [Candidatus Rhodobacter oscarellae]|uniref:Arginine/ornithine antiporter ArcD n=1 Tax=Candidatus Rhodobacter oscarellae TaxID=1675527 RepID=A0A0J9E546_9RHOB|nr:DMT family transporter [Candidatus Rhodobacter lobularis]KMW56924.1 Arginine/ornithine antiporter ArcD [Candidatus Rhodobacter lobularis]
MTLSAPARAAVWMTGAILSFTAMAVSGRELAGMHDTFEIMTYRSLLGVVMVLAVAGWAGTLGQITTRRLWLHGLRNLFHFIGQNLWFFAVGVGTVPLAQIFAFEFTTPIWATFLAALFLGERLTRIRLAAAALGFAGAMIVAQPGADFELSPGLVAAALAAIGFAGTAVCTRSLVRTETITCVLFYLTVIQAVLGLGTAFMDGAMAPPSGASLPWLMLVAVCGLVAHFCVTKALTLAPAGVVMTMDFARLPIIAVVGMLFYAEPFLLAVFLGGAFIFAANALNIRNEARSPSK